MNACFHCRSDAAAYRCAACKVARYCGAECQRSAWMDGVHGDWCPVLQRVLLAGRGGDEDDEDDETRGGKKRAREEDLGGGDNPVPTKRLRVEDPIALELELTDLPPEILVMILARPHFTVYELMQLRPANQAMEAHIQYALVVLYRKLIVDELKRMQDERLVLQRLEYIHGDLPDSIDIFLGRIHGSDRFFTPDELKHAERFLRLRWAVQQLLDRIRALRQAEELLATESINGRRLWQRATHDGSVGLKWRDKHMMVDRFHVLVDGLAQPMNEMAGNDAADVILEPGNIDWAGFKPPRFLWPTLQIMREDGYKQSDSVLQQFTQRLFILYPHACVGSIHGGYMVITSLLVPMDPGTEQDLGRELLRLLRDWSPDMNLPPEPYLVQLPARRGLYRVNLPDEFLM